jgi:N-acetylmuramoyl-L-alanine amidase
VDLTRHDDEVAGVLMDLARTETQPRSERLAEAMKIAIGAADIKMHRQPRQSGAFSVLKAPDIPSVLLEIGFLSSAADRKRLADPEWRARTQRAILSALQAWAIADAAEARLIRQ